MPLSAWMKEGSAAPQTLRRELCICSILGFFSTLTFPLYEAGTVFSNWDKHILPLCIPVSLSFSTVNSYISPNSSNMGRRSFSSKCRGICPINNLMASWSLCGGDCTLGGAGCCCKGCWWPLVDGGLPEWLIKPFRWGSTWGGYEVSMRVLW